MVQISSQPYPYTPKINGYQLVSNFPYLNDVARGNTGTANVWEKIGYNPDVDDIEEDVIIQGGTYTFPTAGMQMLLSSTGTNDTSAGIGARTVTLYYLNSSYVASTETLTMNSSSNVPTLSSDIYRINDMRVATTGATGVAHGTITAIGNTSSLTYGFIDAGYNRDRQMIYTVPAGKTLYVTDATLSVSAAAIGHYVRLFTKATYDNRSNSTLTPGLMFQMYHEELLQDASIVVPFSIPTKFPAQTDIKCSALGDANTSHSKVAVVLRGWLE